MPADTINIAETTHPFYLTRITEWEKWRLTYEGGPAFIQRYLEKFSRRETNSDHERRLRLTYNPAFAKQAVEEIKNSIFQRMVDVSRKGGSESYQFAVDGLEGGVDRLGSSMNCFLGRYILPELLTMAKVGIFVDMPHKVGATLAEAGNTRPYIYCYKAEDIRSWCYDDTYGQNQFSTVLLRDYLYEYDVETGLPTGVTTRYRRMWLADGVVYVKYYNESGEPTVHDVYGDEPILLEIDRIPFIVLELSDSLLKDVANYQVGLLNLASGDMAYAMSANFPFYTEQFDPRLDQMNIRPAGQAQGGEAPDAAAAKTQEVQVGVTRGRRYPLNTERPAFIHPSSEPLKASMGKQDQMKQEIRQLVSLAVSNLIPKVASAESKGYDQQGLEAGLSNIGIELEAAERQVASFWAMYEAAPIATVNYPKKWSLKTDTERRDDAKSLKEIADSVPSKTFQKAVAKQIAVTLLGDRVSREDLDKIAREIDNAPTMTADPETIAKDVEIGILDLETASKIRGYPPGTVDKAADDHANRLARIQKAQSVNNEQNVDKLAAARGIKDGDSDPQKSGKDEKKQSRDTTQDDTVRDKTRGQNQSSS